MSYKSTLKKKVALALFKITVTITFVTVTERLSIRQVAQRAGVSRTTVSRALNNHPEISHETRQRVLEIVRELEYAPVAGPMVHSRHIKTGIIGLVFDKAGIEDRFGMPTFLGMREAAMKYDYDLLTLLKVRPDWMAGQEELQFLDRRSDGLIFIAPECREQMLQALMKHQMPVVTCYMENAPANAPLIALDNADAMRQAVNHVIANGHERILFLTIFTERSDFKERQHGFEEAMQRAGLIPHILCISDVFDVACQEKLLAYMDANHITAIVCAVDSLAGKAINLLVSVGKRIPEDISIVGMDDLAGSAQRGLTSVHYSCEEVGRRAVETLVSLIQGGVAESMNSVVPVELVPRSSVAPPP